MILKPDDLLTFIQVEQWRSPKYKFPQASVNSLSNVEILVSRESDTRENEFEEISNPRDRIR